MQLRPARSADLPRLQVVEVAAGQRFREAGMPAVADDPPPTVAELATAAALVVAVDDDDRPVAYVRLEVVDGHAHLEQLSVHPRHGRQGLGTALLEAAHRWAAERGDPQITLTTFRDVAFNAPYYAGRGYVELPPDRWGPELAALVAREAAHGLDPEHRVVMHRRL